MKIDYKTCPHPKIENRDITFIFIDNIIDLSSARFLVHEARYGGWHGSVAGFKSHRTRAIKLGELYRHLDDLGLNWQNALEINIKQIRNAMLHWDANDNVDHGDYGYSSISNDAMNQKISVWFKFYKYMEEIGIPYDMTMATKWVKRKTHQKMLSHLEKRTLAESNMIEIWTIRVKPSPEKRTYHAISKSEFKHLYYELNKIDKVFGMLAYFMVESGLRVKAALDIEVDTFKSYFKHLNMGKNMDDTIDMMYFAKGGVLKKAEIPIRAIATIQKEYLVREHSKRIRKHSDESKKGKYVLSENSMWLLSNGRKVNYSDVQRAFKKASENMGRTQSITSHWMRHTFATWTLIDYAKKENIALKNTGVIPNPMLMILLSAKMGHNDPSTTMKYIVTALKLEKMATHKGPKMSLLSFRHNIGAQEAIRNEAKDEFADAFNEELFDLYKYAQTRKFIHDDD